MCTHHYILNKYENNAEESFKGICKLCGVIRVFPKWHEALSKSWKVRNEDLKEMDLNRQWL